MKSRSIYLAVALVAVFALVASAADVSGKWTAQVPGRQGNTQETTFNLKADGAKLTGTVVNPRGEQTISDGTVSGDDLSFTVTANFGGNEMKMQYKGKVAGAEIKFTRTVTGRDAPPVEFVAKRATT